MGLDEHGLAVEPGERPSDHSPDVDLDASHRLDALAAPDTGPVTRAEKYDDFGRRIKKHVTESDVFSRYGTVLHVLARSVTDEWHVSNSLSGLMSQ